MKKKQKKVFEMNEDYGDIEELETLGIGEVDRLIYSEVPNEDVPVQSMQLTAQVEHVVRGLSGAKSGGQVYLVDIRKLEPYPDQPFRPYTPEQLRNLADDIARVGVLSPILARRVGVRLQILAGHNRWQAAKLAGLSEVPVILLDADDDRAVLVLTSTNLRQRERLLPSEKAFAYKMQMEALKRQGQRTGEQYNAASFITEQTGDSRMQIHRYVRLTELEAGLLEQLDRGRISMTPAVSVSYLTPENQREVLRCIREHGASLTIERSNRLKSMAEEGILGAQRIDEIMLQTGNKKKKSPEGEYVQLRFDRIRDLLPEGVSPERAEVLIVEALTEYAKTANRRG